MIGFLAKRRRGKDTAADHLTTLGYTKRAFAYPLKKGIQEWFGFTDEQLFTDEKECIDKNWGVSPREVCQVVGTEVVRDLFPKILIPGIGEDFWVRSADIWYEKNKNKHNGLVVWSDVRYQNEVDYILNKGGKVYKIERPGLDICIDSQADLHKSETSIDKINHISGVIINDGTLEDFYRKLNKLITHKKEE